MEEEGIGFWWQSLEEEEEEFMERLVDLEEKVRKLETYLEIQWKVVEQHHKLLQVLIQQLKEKLREEACQKVAKVTEELQRKKT